MFKFEHYFLNNGKWENNGYSIRDRFPEKGDEFYNKGKRYIVVDIKEQEDEYNIFDIFLEE